MSFNSCDSFLDYLKAAALDRVGPYGLEGLQPSFASDDLSASAEAAPTGARDAVADTGSGSTYTGTNVQEAGVDEADITKTDGKRIVTMSENRLAVVDITATTPVVTGTISLDTAFASELFLVGDRAIVLSNAGGGWISYDTPPFVPEGDFDDFDDIDSASSVESVEPSADVTATTLPPDDVATTLLPDAGSAPMASIIEIDLAAANGPEIVNTVKIEGQYLSARLIGQTIRLAINSTPNSLPWLLPQNQAGEQAATDANRKVIEDSTLDDWLPHFEITGVAGDSSGALLPCESVRHPAEFAGFDTVSVIDIDLTAAPAVPTNAVGVLASGQQVYSSLDRFYVASTQWLPPEVDPNASAEVAAWGENFQTDIHAFALSDVEPTRYVGSGSVDGTLLNQFSMDESAGYLRVITTIGSPWSRLPDDEPTSESMLTVLAEQGDQLVPVGQVGGLGKGESLYSARLFDDVGFAVTFRQTDPLYVLDLSDPTNPRVTGELKIPGVSTYLHPVSETRILGIGQDATEEGVTTGLKLSLFDVSDRANPTEISVWTLPDSTSPVEYDHRAFQMVGPTAIVPVEEWGRSTREIPRQGFNGAVVFNIVDQIIETGRVTNVDETAEPTSDCQPVDTSQIDGPIAELFAVMADSGAHVQVCSADAVGGWGNDQCEPLTVDQLTGADYGTGFEVAESDLEALGLGDGGRIELCFPSGNSTQSIQRSVVVDSTLFTVSAHSVVSTDLATMTPIGRADF